MSQASLDRFLQAVLRDAALQEQLWQVSDKDAFFDLAQHLGAQQGEHFSSADVAAILYESRLEWRDHAAISTTPVDLSGWMPARVSQRGAQTVVEWCYIGRRRFVEPFYEHTIHACLRHPFNRLVRLLTPIDALTELQTTQPGLPPNGFIFHMSRCGSTLIAQLLASLPQAIMISEAEPIDGVLRANQRNPAISDDQRAAWLHAAISALGRARAATDRLAFFKFDSWSVLDLPLIRHAYPDVPWIFVFRDPLEVMVSHQKLRGSQMIPGVIEPALLGMEPAAIAQMTLDEYCARTLGRICEAAVRYGPDRGGLFVGYRELPDLVWSALLSFFCVAVEPSDVERMRQVAQFHAKRPAEQFVDDTQSKRQAASDDLRRLAAEWVMPAYRHLLALQADRNAKP